MATEAAALRLRRMVHLSKLAVGIRDTGHLRAIQAQRAAAEDVIQHRTRAAPRRLSELLDGGSLYWVINGVMQVRQLVLSVRPGQREDGTACTSLVLDESLILVEPRTTRAFQGWRYLERADAPLDLSAAIKASGAELLPERMQRELRSLALL